MTQNVANDFWDAENANGERSNDPTPECSFLAQPGKAPNPQGSLGGESMEKARGTWNTCPTYMDTGWSHTFIVQIHTKLPAPKFQGLPDPWSWKATDGNKTTQLYSGTTTSSLLAAGHPDWPSSGSRPHSDLARSCSPLRIGCSNLSSSGSLLRTGHPAGQTGSRMVPSLPVIAKTAFPKPALVTGIPSGSLSQEQVTRQVYTETLASLAMSPLEIAYFPEFFCV